MEVRTVVTRPRGFSGVRDFGMARTVTRIAAPGVIWPKGSPGAGAGMYRSSGMPGWVRQRGWISVAVALVMAVMLSGVTGCSRGRGHGAAAGPVTVAVSPSRPLQVTVPGVATVRGPRGAFRGRGTVTVRPVRAPLPFRGSLVAAGTGIDVTFSGVMLARPLTNHLRHLQ